MNTFTDFRTPLARAKGLGGTPDGAEHWTAERVSALLLTPLTLWAVGQILRLAGQDRKAILKWASRLHNAGALTLLIALIGRHTQLGLEVVATDYSRGWQRLLIKLLIRLSCLLFVAIGGASVVRVLATRTSEEN